MTQELFWNPNRDILENEAAEALHLILSDDGQLAARVEAELSDALGLLDAYLALFIRLLQMAYREPTEWQEKDSIRASIGMAVSGFNYLLLARLGVVHGYYPEVRSLLRDCYERMSRCMLFKREPKVAQSWLNGSKIQQREVDDKLSKSLEGEDPMQAKVYRQLRGKYYQDSEAVHPNLSSLLMRLAVDSPEEAADRVGKDVFLGGVMGKHYGRVTLLTVVSSARIAVTVFRNLFEGNLNEFDEEFDDLNALFDAAAQPG